MPKDDWNKAKRMDVARQATRTKNRPKPIKTRRITWREAILCASTHSELTAIARMVEAAKCKLPHYSLLVALGKKRRQEINKKTPSSK